MPQAYPGPADFSPATPETDAVAPEHYFSAQPATPKQLRTITVPICGELVKLSTAPGVFSPQHIDAGTNELLRRVPDPPAVGNFLDLGCGWGPIALTLATLSPGARVWAVDVNERALDLTRGNAEKLRLDNVYAELPDDVVTSVKFDLIWSNPPIRIGKAALHEMLIDWLPRLTPDGEAWLVVQRNLGADSLRAWLNNDCPVPVIAEKHSSAKGFQVIKVQLRN